MEKTANEKAYFVTGLITGSALTIFLFLSYRAFNKMSNRVKLEIDQNNPKILPEK